MRHLHRAMKLALPTTFRLAVIALAIHGGLDLTRGALAQEEQHAYMPYAEQSGSLAERVAELEYLLESFSRDGDTVIVSGANLQVVNGTGSTDGEPNGLGNVVVGYNELRGDGTDDRSGSHMLVVGERNNYSRFGGIVVGVANSAMGEFSSVSGGSGNAATGTASAVSGGTLNNASQEWATISGGIDNTASGPSASVSGGSGNTASGSSASVSGGMNNTASGPDSSVTGGWKNTAVGDTAAACGGYRNMPSGDSSSICGGSNNVAAGWNSSVSGGNSRSVSGDNDWRAGSLFEDD